MMVEFIGLRSSTYVADGDACEEVVRPAYRLELTIFNTA